MVTKEDRAELQRQADAGELGASGASQQMQLVKRVQGRAFALDLAAKMHAGHAIPVNEFQLLVRFIFEFMNETD